jgi:ribosomal protein S27AE
MIAALDFLPKFCPNCGREDIFNADHLGRADYYGGAAHSCSCGFRFQFVIETKILNIADDLKYYTKQVR